MRSNRVSASSKYCATCEYWGAMRQARRSEVECEECGVCSNRRASYYGRKKRYKDSCSKYEKWIVLMR